MRVIARQNQHNQITCRGCGCTIEYDERDLIDFECGYGFMCPECHKEIYVKQWIPHQFPQAFHAFGTNQKCVKINDADTQEMINKVVNNMKEIDFGEFVYTGTGDTVVIGMKAKDEDTIIVAKNYWEEAYNFRN